MFFLCAGNGKWLLAIRTFDCNRLEYFGFIRLFVVVDMLAGIMAKLHIRSAGCEFLTAVRADFWGEFIFQNSFPCLASISIGILKNVPIPDNRRYPMTTLTHPFYAVN